MAVLAALCFAVPLEGRSLAPALSLLILAAVAAGTVLARRRPAHGGRAERVLRDATVASLWAIPIVLAGVAIARGISAL